MEPQSAQRLDKFTGNVPGSINFHLWKQLFLASAMAKGLETAFQEQDKNGLTAPKLAAANKADVIAVLLFEIQNAIFVRFGQSLAKTYKNCILNFEQ